MLKKEELWNTAKRMAKESSSGGVHMKIAKLEEQIKEIGVAKATTVALSATSYGIGKVPLVGQELSFAFDQLVSDPIGDAVNAKTLEVLLNQAEAGYDNTHKVIQYRNEKINADLADVFGQYTVMRKYFEKKMKDRPLPKSCDDAFKMAFEYALAKSCISDLEKNLKMIEDFVVLVRKEVDRMKPAIKSRKKLVELRIDTWEDQHDDKKKCLGLHPCYYDSTATQQSHASQNLPQHVRQAHAATWSFFDDDL